jgi:hypothetical protein
MLLNLDVRVQLREAKTRKRIAPYFRKPKAIGRRLTPMNADKNKAQVLSAIIGGYREANALWFLPWSPAAHKQHEASFHPIFGRYPSTPNRSHR